MIQVAILRWGLRVTLFRTLCLSAHVWSNPHPETRHKVRGGLSIFVQILGKK